VFHGPLLEKSSTSTQGKQVFLDSALVERMNAKRVLLVDDVINTGVSAVSAIRLLQRTGAQVVGIVTVLSEGHA
jgi:adenine/guanine phosphoribosyltransferase-like PRPP-binding protein